MTIQFITLRIIGGYLCFRVGYTAVEKNDLFLGLVFLLCLAVVFFLPRINIKKKGGQDESTK